MTMNNNLYWTANGINKNAYGDGFLHSYKAVKGNKFAIDKLEELDLFSYTDNNKTFIILKNIGIAVVTGESLEDATDKLKDLIDTYGVNRLLNEIKKQMEIRKPVPDTPPTAENEVIELDTYISNKTGEPNENHTKWYKQKINN